ncbi:carboxypeptidase-like regulatory domain-containing protein [uncultured Paludibaculum sp.]|uniref:carboxypeptidase-like regulatory domain-containing protein n=1 Tax=uncultured Paludibaculum sp. TaxID=1765020 RepID=UPI002AAC0D16|nr:carboxypeptidase-like regulatory domain-containing protein [uncultured Paludibaculum sp.]
MDGWPDAWSSHISIDGDRFIVTGLPAGRYRVELDDSQGPCRLTEVRVGDMISGPASILLDGSAHLAMVLSGGRGSVTGIVTTASGHIASGWVALVSDEVRRAARLTRLDADGHYRFDSVSPGPYLVVSVGAMESLDYLDPVAAHALGALPVIVETNRTVNANVRSAQ